MDMVKAIAVFQVLGGLHGLALLLTGAPMPEMGEAGPVSYGIFAFLCVVSVAAGSLLWFQKRSGFVGSILVQALQAVRLTFGPLNFGFHLLGSLDIYIRFVKSGPGIGLDLGLFESYFYFYTHVVYKFNLYLPFEAVLNVSAMLGFFYLYYVFDGLFPMESPHALQEEAEHVA